MPSYNQVETKSGRKKFSACGKEKMISTRGLRQEFLNLQEDLMQD